MYKLSDNEPVAARISNDPGEEGELLHSGASGSGSGSAQRENKTLQEMEMGVAEAEGVTSPERPKRCFLIQWFNVVIPYGGLISSCFNLASATLGAGILGLPAAFNTSGVLMSVIYLVVITTLTAYSMNLLGQVMERTGIRTFEAMSRTLLGPGWDYFIAAVMWLNCFGACIAYVISTSNLLTPILNGAPHAPAYLKTTSGIRLLTSLVWFVAMLPLVIPKRINSVRYASTLGVLFIVYFVIVIVIHAGLNGLKGGLREDVVLFGTGNAAVEGLGVFMFAYLCQINAFDIYWEMTNRSVSKLTWYSVISMGVCGMLYFFAGFFGYADFGPSVTGSILLMYKPIQEPYAMVAYCGVLIKLCAAYALHMIPCRHAIFHVIRWNVETTPYWKHSIVVVTLAVISLLAGLFIPKINVVFGLAGAFCGGWIGFVYPAMFIMYAGNWSLKTVGWFHYISTYVLLIVGIVAIVFGTGGTIYSIIVPA